MKSDLNRADQLTRRRFAARAAQTFLGVSTLPASIMFGDTVLAAGQGASQLKQIPTAKRVIYLYLSGGMSHLDTLDPKPGQEAMGPTKTLNTPVDGMQLGEYLPRLAKRSAPHLAVVRSLSSTQGAHKQGNYFMHTGYELRSSIRHPALGAWLLHLQGTDNPSIPGNVMIGNDSRHPGAGFLEAAYQPLMINDPAGGLRHQPAAGILHAGSLLFQLQVSAKLDRAFAEKYNQRNVRAYQDMYQDAIRLMDSQDLAAFDLSKESELDSRPLRR